MAEQNALLQLRDIHQPAAVSWWPPAPGWFILFFLVIIISFFLGRFIYRTWRRHQRKRYALSELRELALAYQNKPDCDCLAKAMVLLKRVVMTRYARHQVASMTGQEWLVFLDTITKTDQYTKGVGVCLLDAPYQKISKPVPQVFALIEKTFKRCL